MFDFDYISNNVQLFNQTNYLIDFDPQSICDYFPSQYKNDDWLNTINLDHPSIKILSTILLDSLLDSLIVDNKIIVSLSGGVDSMVTLFLLIHLKINKKINKEIIACHIIYGNRYESNFEFNFIKFYCSKLNIKLYYYNIEYLTRKNIDRDFYEKITRDIRFNLYKSICKDSDFSVCLGHIKDDVIENIWSNFSKGQHIFDLKKMKIMTQQDGVKIIRPFLNVNKSTIFEIAHHCYIPYLKNTTPEWSNRGKFRNRFYKETHTQYGDSVDEKIIQVADTLSNVGNILDNLIYKPIYKSYNNIDKTINVSRAIEAQLDINGWLNIIEHVCHNFLQITKPSIHSIKQFVERLNKNNFTKEMKFQLKNNLQKIIYKKNCDNYFIKFFI